MLDDITLRNLSSLDMDGFIVHCYGIAGYFRIKNFRTSVQTSISAVFIFEVGIFRSSYS